MICISWGPPSSKQQAACLARCKEGGFNYDIKYVGATNKSPFSKDHTEELQKDGYVLNHAQVQLGSGQGTFLKGREMLRTWRHFQIGWALVDPTTPIKVEQRFCVCAREFCTWVLNPLEILYVNDTQINNGKLQPQKASRLLLKSASEASNLKEAFIFGSGTLNGHLLAGEEMFAIKWEEDDTVWYEIKSFSRPAHILSKATYPYVRWRQKFFANQSMNAMLKAVSD